MPEDRCIPQTILQSEPYYSSTEMQYWMGDYVELCWIMLPSWDYAKCPHRGCIYARIMLGIRRRTQIVDILSRFVSHSLSPHGVSKHMYSRDELMRCSSYCGTTRIK